MGVKLPVVPEAWVEETVEIRNRGAYTIPNEARKAHRCTIDVEVVSVTREQFKNLMYNLPQGNYLNVTAFNGAAICDTIVIRYPTQRLLDWVNIEASVQYSVARSVRSTYSFFELIMQQLSINYGLLPSRPDNSWGLPWSHLKFVAPPDTQVRVRCRWYLFNEDPDVANPDPQTGDAQEGKDEYREPSQNSPNSPFSGNPPATERDTNRDPRDYGPDTPQAVWKVWLVGSFLNNSGQYEQQSSEPTSNDAFKLTQVNPEGQQAIQGVALGNGPDGQPVYSYSFGDGQVFNGGWKPNPSLAYLRVS